MEAVRKIRGASRFRIESLCEHHELLPKPRCKATVVDIVAVPG